MHVRTGDKTILRRAHGLRRCGRHYDGSVSTWPAIRSHIDGGNGVGGVIDAV